MAIIKGQRLIFLTLERNYNHQCLSQIIINENVMHIRECMLVDLSPLHKSIPQKRLKLSLLVLSVSASNSFFMVFHEQHSLTTIILRKLSLELIKELISVSTVSQIFSQLFETVKVFLRLRQFLVLFTKPFILVIFCFEKVSARIFHSVPSTYEWICRTLICL